MPGGRVGRLKAPKLDEMNSWNVRMLPIRSVTINIVARELFIAHGLLSNL